MINFIMGNLIAILTYAKSAPKIEAMRSRGEVSNLMKNSILNVMGWNSQKLLLIWGH
jgi:hypothetical protein